MSILSTRSARSAAAWTLVVLAALLLPASGQAARLQVSPKAVKVTPQEGARVELRLDVKDAQGAPRSGLRFLAESNFGSVGSVEETAPGRYEASLRLPPTDMPRAALVLFSAQDSDSIELHHAIVPVTVSTHLRAQTEPRSQVTISTGGREFGPAKAGRTGWFTLAFDQPPGATSAQVLIVDAAGNVQRSEIPVPVRPHDALTATLDRYRVASDGQGRVHVHAFVFDELGRPVRNARVQASCDRGSLGEFVDHGDGVHGATWTAPADGKEGVATIRLAVRQGGKLHEEIERVRIVRGPAGRLVLSAEPTEFTAGEQSEVALRARVTDAAGNGLPGESIRLSTDRGSVDELTDLGDGRYSSRLRVPTEVGSGSIEVKALLVQGEPERRPARIDVTANPKVVPTSWRAFSLVTATVTDEAGAPVAGEVVLFHVARGEGTVTPTAVTNADGRAFADFSASQREEIVAVEAVATSNPSLKGETRIEKKASGEFAIINRPARAAQGASAPAVYEFDDGRRVLQDTALITIHPGTPASISLAADPSRLVADGTSTSRLTAVLKDARGNEIAGATLSFETDVGSVTEGSNASDGTYLSTFTSPEGRGSGLAKVTVTESETGLTASTTIELEVGPPAQLALVVDRDTLPADGSSEARLTASVSDASGEPVPDVQVSFRWEGAEVELTPGAVTDDRGEAEARLTAGRESGEVTLVAESEGGLSATAQIELLPTEPVELRLRVSPDSILANGAERSELSAELEDAQGQPVVDHVVEFRIETGPGRLSKRSARSDSQGIARSWLSSTRPGTATIEARSQELPSLRDRDDVELRPAALLASFAVEGPACSGAVRLVSDSEPDLAHEWDWTGDGLPDATGTSVLAPLSAGTTSVRLRVADAAGNEAATELDVDVLPSPVAVATAGATRVTQGDCTSLDGSGSSGTGTLSWSWDLDGDGMADATGPVLANWCETDGRRVAVLTVTDASGCSATDSVEVLFGDLPELSIAVSAPGVSLPILADRAFELRIDWGNLGRATAPSTLVDVQLSPELSLNGALPSGGLDLGGGLLRFPLGDLAAASSGHFTLPLRATATPMSPSSLARVTANIRHAISGGESQPVEASRGLPIVPHVDLALGCASPDSAKPGDVLRLDLDLENRGASPASSVELVIDWRDDELLLESSSPAGVASPGRLRLSWAALAASDNESIELSFRARDVQPATMNQVRVVARASHAGVESVPGEESCSSIVEVEAAPDTWIVIEATPDHLPAHPTHTVLYELRYGNRGSTAATGVVLEGRFDSNVFENALLENPDAGIFSTAAGTIRFFPGSVPADPSRTERVRYRVRLSDDFPAGASEVLTEAEIRHDAVDALPGDDFDTHRLPVEAAPVLTLSANVPAGLRAGEVGTVTLTARSTGDVTAEAVVIEQAFSGADASIVAGSLPGSATVLPDGRLRWTPGDLPPGLDRTLRYDIRAASQQPAVDPTLALDWAASYGTPASPESAAHHQDIAIDANAFLALRVELSANVAAAGDTVEATIHLDASGAAPHPAGTVDLGWNALLFDGAAPSGRAFPSLSPGSSHAIGPLTLPVAAVLPATTNDTSVTASVSGTATTGAAALRLTAAPALDLRVAALPTSAAAGDWFDVSVAYENTGSTAATGVVLSIAEAPGLAGLLVDFDPPLRAIGLVPADGVERTTAFRARVADVLPACSSSAGLVARALLTEAPGSVIGPVAPLDATGEPDLGLTVRLDLSRDPPGPNDLVTLHYELTNHGTAPASSPEVVLDRDSALLPDVVPPVPSGATWTADEVRIPLADLPAGAMSTGSVRMRVIDPLPNSTNPTELVATASESSCERDATDNQVLRPLVIGAVADLVVEMSVLTDPADLVAGGSVGVTVFLSNEGNAHARSADLTLGFDEALVGGVTAPGGSVAGGVVSWSGLDVLAGAPPLRFDVTLQVADELPAIANLLTFAAETSTGSPENRLDNNRADEARTARAWADLCLELTAVPVPQPATASGRLEYGLSLVNNGTTTATGTVLTLDYDSSLLSPQGASGDPLVWTLGDLAPGASIQIDQTMQIVNSIPGGTASACADATVTSPEHDAWGEALCTTPPTLCTVITDQADLRLTKEITGRPPILLRDDVVQYTITVRNEGNADVDGGALKVGSVEDLVPAGLTPDTLGGGTWDGTVLRWDLPTRLRKGDSWSTTYGLRIDTGLMPGVHRLENVATVLPDFADASASNDSDSEVLHLRFDTDLATRVTCAADPAPATPGSLLRYEVVVENIGSYEATNLQLALDGGPDLVYEPPLSGSGPIVVPGPATLPAQSSWVYRFEARSLEAFPDAVTVVALEAQASSPEADADPNNDLGQTSCTVLSTVDLRTAVSITEADGTPPAGASEDLDVSVAMENVGTRIESGVQLVVDYDETLVAVTPPGGFAPNGPGSIRYDHPGPFGPADGQALAIPMRVVDVLPSSLEILEVCSTLSSPGPDVFPADNRRCDQIQLFASPDLVVSLSASTPSTPAQPGEAISYTAQVENRGTTRATGVVLNHVRDAVRTTGLLPGSTSHPATESGNTISLTLGAIDVGPASIVTATWQVGIASTLPEIDAIATGQACAGASESDLNPGDDCDSADVTIEALPDAEVSLRVEPSSGLGAGDGATAFIDYGNVGSSPLRNPTLTLTLDSAILLSDGAGGTTPGPLVLNGLPDIGPGEVFQEVRALQIADVLPAASNSLDVTASLAHDETPRDADPANDSMTVQVAANGVVDLVATVSLLSPADPQPGDELTYEIGWRNDGSTAATGVSLELDPSDLLTLPDGSAPPDPETRALADVAAGAAGSLQVLYRLPDAMPQDLNTISLRATLASDGPEVEPADNTAWLGHQIAANPDVRIASYSVTADSDPPICGSSVTATAEYDNHGSSTARDTEILFVFDDAVSELVNAGGGVFDGSNRVTFTVGDLPVSAGMPAVVSIELRVRDRQAASMNPLIVTAEISASNEPAGLDGDNQGIDVKAVEADVDLVTKLELESASPDPAEAGGTITLLATIGNRGCTRAEGATLNLDWTGGLVASVIDDDGASSSDQVSASWTLGTLLPGDPDVERRLTLRVEDILPAATNLLQFDATSSSTGTERNEADNNPSLVVPIVALVDLMLSASVSPPGPVAEGANVTYSYSLSNQGSTAAVNPCVDSAYDSQLMNPWLWWPANGSADGSTMQICAGVDLDPGAPPINLTVIHQMVSPGTGEVRHDIDRTHVAAEQGKTPAEDRNPADNVATTSLLACYLSATISSPAPRQVCLDSSITLVANTDVTDGISYEWVAVDGGSFDDPTARVVTFTPPSAAGNYRVHVRLTHTSGCTYSTEDHNGQFNVRVVADCTSCGCHPANLKLVYVPGTLERVDQAGSQTVSPGETVSFRLRVTDSGTGKSAWVRTGTTISFDDGAGHAYAATLSYPVFYECRNEVTLTFDATQVDPAMSFGDFGPSLLVDAIDACGNGSPRNSSISDDVSVAAPLTGGVDPGVSFSDWGPERVRR